MAFTCNLCNKTFALKHHLQRHLDDKRCNGDILDNYSKLNEILEENKQLKELLEENKQLKEQMIIVNGNNNNSTNNKTNNVTINVTINPITKLNTSYLKHELMQEIVDVFDVNPERINLLLSDYISQIIHNKEHPENHAVKYVSKRPPLFNTQIEKNGETVGITKNIKETCALIVQPIQDILAKKLRRFDKKYQEDDDYCEKLVRELKNEMNSSNVKNALKSVLTNEIINDLEMKLGL